MLKFTVKKDLLVKDRSVELVRPVPPINAFLPRNYKSVCIVCDSISYSYNRERKYLCFYCVKIVYFRDVLSFLVAKRKRKFKKTLFAMKRLIDSRPIEGVFGVENEWANTMTWFFKTMSWDIKDHMLSFLFTRNK